MTSLRSNFWSSLLAVVLIGVATVGACDSSSKRDSNDDDDAEDGGQGFGGALGIGGSPNRGGAAGSGATSGRGGANGGGSGGRGGTAGTSGTAGTDGGEAGVGGGVEPPDTCDSDADCQPAGLVCDPLSSECVECLLDNHCAPDEECHDRLCKPVIDCTISTDCAGEERERVCNTAQGRCVECLTIGDCPADHDCTANRCVPFDACRNSLDCPVGRVCDAVRGRCVECTADPDCPMGERCVTNQCRLICASDNACTPLGMLCNLSGGYCVSCLQNADCPEVYYCSQGECVLDACLASGARCEGNTLATCRAAGDGYDRAACGARQTCVEDGNNARCDNWVCTAGQVECDASAQNIVRCAPDGLSVEESTDCGDDICVAAQCRDLVCVPSARYCDGETIRQCSSDGLTSTLVQTCGASQFCDDTTATCRAWVCTPNQPWCNGTLAQVCNPRGSGSVAPGTDCAATTGRQCSNGACLCQTNRADCDGVAGTGCEVNVSTDTSNCGACGRVCSNNHVPTPACSASTCAGTCEPGYTDCNADKRTDGCETNTAGDPANCGACGRVCSSNHVPAPACGASTCNGACQTGFGDCNSNKQTDGCEIDTQTDPSHCGGCAQSCSSANMATRTCGSATCNGTCVTGFADCNSNKRTDGCEADVRFDEANCGTCGNPCPQGQSCVNQVCTTCNNTVLFLGDANTTANAALEAALEAQGLVVTLINGGANSYNNVPPAVDFGAVVVPVGGAYTADMTAGGQSAIVAANAAGTGFVATEWAAYMSTVSRWATLRQLVLMTRTGVASGQITTFTLSVAGHPLWDGLPSPFTTTQAMSYNIGAVVNGGTTIATCSVCTSVGGVVAKDAVGSAGRIAYIPHAANQTNATWYNDVNLLKMFTNAGKWATGCFP